MKNHGRFFLVVTFLIAIVPAVLAQTAADGPRNPVQGIIASTPNYGLNSDSVVTIAAHDFDVYEVGSGPTSTSGNAYRWITSGSNKIFFASVSVPSGVTITNASINYCDNVGTGAWELVVYDFFGDNGFTTVADFIAPDRTGCGYAFSPLAYQFDSNAGHNLMIYAFQGGSAVAGEVKFRGVEVYYRRKVSPAPATASFGDVSNSHPFYRFIEALAASGITGGCGGGNFCPNAPITRGEMAVFLAGALGLHFPN